MSDFWQDGIHVNQNIFEGTLKKCFILNGYVIIKYLYAISTNSNQRDFFCGLKLLLNLLKANNILKPTKILI